LLRIDLGFEVVERDAEARYVIFRYSDGEHSFPATLEIAERPTNLGVPEVTVVISVPAQPTYVELHLLDRLERKLREEMGPPVQPTPPPRPAARPDRSHDDDHGDSEENDDDDHPRDRNNNNNNSGGDDDDDDDHERDNRGDRRERRR